MRVGIVFHKDPFAVPAGIDLVRLRAISKGLRSYGLDAEIVAPVQREDVIEQVVPVRPLSALRRKGRYDIVKTCYHYSVELIGEYSGPVVSRIVRVVDVELPERDGPNRGRLLECQELIRKRASAVALNNHENEQRWRAFYGDAPPVVLTPTGCPADIPSAAINPFPAGERSILFLGSVAAPRMADILNAAAEQLAGLGRVHLVGRNKAAMYGDGQRLALSHLIVDHGEVPQEAVWNYILNARMGLALAAGPYPFDNDVSKIVYYLRGGLPVLSEEPIINNRLIGETGFGATFPHGNVDGLVAAAARLLENPPVAERRAVMAFMAREHSWDRRVQTYVSLFRKIVG
jgi:glycosyltransferase involved in cell wall biosynthesis